MYVFSLVIIISFCIQWIYDLLKIMEAIVRRTRFLPAGPGPCCRYCGTARQTNLLAVDSESLCISSIDQHRAVPHFFRFQWNQWKSMEINGNQWGISGYGDITGAQTRHTTNLRTCSFNVECESLVCLLLYANTAILNRPILILILILLPNLRRSKAVKFVKNFHSIHLNIDIKYIIILNNN